MLDQRPSPRKFLKALRPERFSDSFTEESHRLDRSVVEYHLGSLTSRSQEVDFQNFLRRLIQLEVCPNLLSQTGPTGGGDSKVDSETYPVSDDHSMVWFVGTNTDAAKERWAFAFSAKKTWRSKVQSDVNKIADTGRAYTKVFFATNQYVSDKKRSEVEDLLSRKHGFEVRIFDLTWILDRIFEGRHEQLVIQELNLQCELRTTIRQGLRDASRQSEWEAIEARIKTAVEQGTQGRILADDCVEAVLLASRMERPRTEVDGLLARAERVAAQYGSSHQQLVAAYQYAWTTFWYFEDFAEFARRYLTVESLARDSENIYHMELLSNLWHLLAISHQRGELQKEVLDGHTQVLVAALDRFVDDETRPSAVFQARSIRLMVELIHSGASEPDQIFRDFRTLVTDSEHLIGFPLAPVVEILTTLGRGFGDNAAFDDLFQTLEDVWGRREGDLAAARLQLRRGAQQLEADCPLQAIRTLGRTLTRLFKDESREELAEALYLCSIAYERVGLLWAARGTAVTASALALHRFWRYEEVTRLQAGCFSRLKWIELQIGRIPQILSWHEVDLIVREVLRTKGDSIDELEDRDHAFDAILGMQFLRFDLPLLNDVGRLPTTLDGLELYNSSLALRFALGEESSVAADLELTADSTLTDHFVKWRDQPACDDLRNEPQLGHQQKVHLQTSVAGCAINVDCRNEQQCVAVAESLLASIESLLATGLADRVFARQSSLQVEVVRSDSVAAQFDHELKEKNGFLECHIRCADFDSNQMTVEQQGEAKRKLLEVTMSVICNCFYIGDSELWIGRAFGDEKAVDRAIHFTSSFVVLGNVLGSSPRDSITEWIQDGAPEVCLSRSKRWDEGYAPHNKQTEEDQKPVEFGSGRPPSGFPNPERVKHSQMQSASLIRVPLWDRAGWAGTSFCVFLEPGSPPFLLPVFRDAEAARAIFKGLREDVGEADNEDLLRVTLIRGISRSNPYAYRIILGTQPPRNMNSSQYQIVAIIARVNTMTPSNSDNLDMFMERFTKVQAYGIAPCILDSHEELEEPMFDMHIKKRQLHVREAWQIGLNDPDLAGIHPDDDPIIPDSEQNPPITELLNWKRSRQ